MRPRSVSFVRLRLSTLVFPLSLGAAVVLLPLALGCAGGGPRAIVSGKVTVDGQPPATGTTVTFVSADGKSVSGAVDTDGSYNVVDAPLGPVKIVVKGVSGGPTAAPKSGGDMPGMAAAGRGAPVPPKYASPDNGLTYDVKAGKQDFDIALKK